MSGLRWRVSNEPLALNTEIIAYEAEYRVSCAQWVAIVPLGSAVCVSLRHPFRISFRNGVVSGVGMGISGFPSLLALSALVGFVVLQTVLAFGT